MPKRSIRKTRKLSKKGGGRSKAAGKATRKAVGKATRKAARKATKAIQKKATKKRKTKGNKKANPWRAHVMKTFRDMKKNNPSTKLSDAFKPASESYKKGTI